MIEVSHSLPTVFAASLVVILASFVQTSTGMGFGLIAAPLLALISIEFVPGPMLFVNLFLSLLMLSDDRSHIVRREIKTLLPTILIGTMLGAVALTQVASESLGIVFACLILMAVAITVMAKPLPLNFRNLAICGVAVGAMGSTAGTPGAPLVVLYQNEPLEKTRPTMAALFTFSYITSLITLSFAGMFNTRLAMDGLVLLPGLLFGYVIGRWMRQFMTQTIGRALMLSIASIGAILLLAKSVSAMPGHDVLELEIARAHPNSELRDTWVWFQSGSNTNGAHNPVIARALQDGDILSLNTFPLILGYYTAPAKN